MAKVLHLSIKEVKVRLLQHLGVRRPRGSRTGAGLVFFWGPGPLSTLTLTSASLCALYSPRCLSVYLSSAFQGSSTPCCPSGLITLSCSRAVFCGSCSVPWFLALHGPPQSLEWPRHSCYTCGDVSPTVLLPRPHTSHPPAARGHSDPQ